MNILRPILEWLNRPWKGIVLLILMPVVGIGAGLYFERRVIDEVFTRMLNDPGIDVAKAETVADNLLAYADLVAVYDVQLTDNVQRALVVVADDGNVGPLLSMAVPFIPPEGVADIVVAELTGSIVCWDTDRYAPSASNTPSRHIEFYIDAGYTYICAQKIPTRRGTIAGVIHMAWRMPPTRSEEFSARTELRATAEDMIVW